MKFKSRLLAILAIVVTATTTLGVAPALAAHYQGGDYGICINPTNGAYAGIYVEAYGVGSDVPRKNAVVAAKATVVAAAKCVQKGAKYHIVRVQIDKVAVRMNNVNYKTVGPVNNGTNSVTAQSGGAAIPCGKYAQSAVRWSARYNDGAVFRGYLNSGSFRRC
ncbi:MAG: hypothetical protein ACR2P2_01390 [Nakamurella sp.]